MTSNTEGDPVHNIKSTSTVDQDTVEDWKHRPPYAIHNAENGDKIKVRYQGSCHCGRVKYQLSREKPLDAKFCHCTLCQRLHSAPFQWAAIFHKTDINFVHGHRNLKWYDRGEQMARYKLPCKVSCAYCGSPIMDEGRNMILLFPSLIHFGKKLAHDDEDDDDANLDSDLEGNGVDFEAAERERHHFAPSCHMFYGSRVVDVPDGKPKWKGVNEKSDLMETEDTVGVVVERREREH